MTNEEIKDLAKKSGLAETILRAALLGMYGTVSWLPLPIGYRPVSFRNPEKNEAFLGSHSKEVVFALNGSIPNEPRIILEPDTIEVEVYTFEPVLENGVPAVRRAVKGEWHMDGPPDFTTFFRWDTERESSYPYAIYRRTVTKKSLPRT
jgi:hypothetical protein